MEAKSIKVGYVEHCYRHHIVFTFLICFTFTFFDLQVNQQLDLSIHYFHISTFTLKIHFHFLFQVNQQLDLSIPVVGEPAPDCKWTLNGQEVKSGDNVKVIMMMIKYDDDKNSDYVNIIDGMKF